MLWLILHHLLRARTHSTTEAAMDVVLVTDDTTRAELEQAIISHRETLRRMPAHWTDRRAAIHARIDAMLTDWEQAAD